MEQEILKFVTDLSKIMLGVMLSFNVALLINEKISSESFFSSVGFWILIYIFVNITAIVMPRMKKKTKINDNPHLSTNPH